MEIAKNVWEDFKEEGRMAQLWLIGQTEVCCELGGKDILGGDTVGAVALRDAGAGALWA